MHAAGHVLRVPRPNHTPHARLVLQAVAAAVVFISVFVLAWAPTGDATGPPYYGPAVLATPDSGGLLAVG